MKKYKCDICGKEVKDEYKLHKLVPGACPPLYNIKEACNDCMSELEKFNAKIRAVLEKAQSNWLQKIVIKMFKRYNHE